MYIKEIYDTVNGIAPLSQQQFITLVNRCLSSLTARYGLTYVFSNGKPIKCVTVEDNIPVYDEWADSISNYVAGNKGNAADLINRFDANLDYVYRTIWKRKIEGNRYSTKMWIGGAKHDI